MNLLFKILALLFDLLGIFLWRWHPALSLLAGLGVYLALQAAYVVLLFLISLFLPKGEKTDRSLPFCRFFVRLTATWVLDLFRIKIELTGAELLPEEPYVLIQNHRSRFDPMVVCRALKKTKMGYISKIENFKIPIVGAFIRNAGFLALDRENPLQAMRILRKGAKMVREDGFCITIYPEGTRNLSGSGLLEFKPGAFVLAKKAAAPLVVSAVAYVGRASNPFRRTRVRFAVLGVLSKEEVAALSPEALAEKCRESIAAFLPN